MAAEPVFIGVDGGASKTHVVALDGAGRLIGEARGPAASLNGEAAPAWAAIQQSLAAIPALGDLDIANAHVVIGIAGTEITATYRAFVAAAPRYASLHVCSDAHVACAGAHALADGAIVSVGTGVVGFCRFDGQTARAGGWGFPHDDRGSGAWLGMEAVAHALAAGDGRCRPDGLSKAVMTDFEAEAAALSAWACHATSGDFARYARVVVAEAEAGNKTADALLNTAAGYVASVARALVGQRADLALALMGGLAGVIAPRLPADLRTRLTACTHSAAFGAALMARSAHGLSDGLSEEAAG